MGFWKISFALVCLISLTLLPSSHAQDSPQDYLNVHNAARAQVGVAPLSWDTNLANYAQRYVNSRIGDCNLAHSGGPYGENIAKSTGDLSGTAAVNLFVSEKADYNYNSNTCAAGKVCGHYTQVVWRTTTRLGCAKVQCNNGGTFIVGEKADYNYNSNNCAAGKVCRHYTQVVWRNTTRLGCAKVRCNNGGTFIGCNYDPRGNIAGQKPY